MKLVFLISITALACHVVNGPNIIGKDVAAADPAFATLDPAAIIASSPIPGVQRILRVRGEELCFERATRILNPSELLEALRGAVLSLRGVSDPLDVQIEILDFTRTPVPVGTLEFTPSGLSPNGIWRGRVHYDDHRTTPIWVKVRVTTEQTWIEALQPLAPGKPIEAGQLALRTGPRSPLGPAPIGAVELIAGRTAARIVRPGEPIFANMLTTPREVERGDHIQVEAVAGEAKISFDAVAQSSGRTGETVLVRNPENGRFFQARVQAKGQVSVTK